MKRFSLGLAAALALAWVLFTAPAYAQITATVVTNCGTPPGTYTAGFPRPVTQDTTGKLCDQGAGSSGGVAGFTAEATASAVAAGTNKPASIDTVNGAQRMEPMKPGTTTPIDLSLPSGVFGLDGSTIMSTPNPFAVQLMAGTAVIGHVINDAGTALIGKAGIDQTTPGTTNGVAVKDVNNVAPDFTLTSPTAQICAYPSKNVAGVVTCGVAAACSSGSVGAGVAACTIAAVASKTNYLRTFIMTSDGATAAAGVVCTITGLTGGTLTLIYDFGVLTAQNNPMVVPFGDLAASATNTAIVGSCPSGGTGAAHAALTLVGYTL